jgi:hypothetical protein
MLSRKSCHKSTITSALAGLYVCDGLQKLGMVRLCLRKDKQKQSAEGKKSV